jgi:alanine racemase
VALSLHVDGDRWRRHLRTFAAENADLVPVAKGNGYGFGVARLARRVQWLGTDMVAVGTYDEVPQVVSRCPADVLVLSPWRPSLPAVEYGDRIVHTVGRLADLGALRAASPRPRVVVEGLTSMRRHGLSPDEFAVVGRSLGGVRLEGVALHLPLADARQNLAEVEAWLARLRSARLATTRVFLSHLVGPELTDLRRRHPDLEVRPRVGTALWLGDRGALSVHADVLDAHPVRRGDRIGYRQRPQLREGTVLVVSGGTSHGIGLEAPSSATSTRQRARSVARGGLDAAGLALSPFTVDGRRRWFVEPPHMQVSLVFVPVGSRVPAVGDHVAADVRHTATTFDRVEIS